MQFLAMALEENRERKMAGRSQRVCQCVFIYASRSERNKRLFSDARHPVSPVTFLNLIPLALFTQIARFDNENPLNRKFC